MHLPTNSILFRAAQRIHRRISKHSVSVSSGFPSLSLESKACADLVGRLVEVLRVERGAEAQRDARAELDVISQSSDAAIVDLRLHETR